MKPGEFRWVPAIQQLAANPLVDTDPDQALGAPRRAVIEGLPLFTRRFAVGLSAAAYRARMRVTTKFRSSYCHNANNT